jgi:hypothetical protein
MSSGNGIGQNDRSNRNVQSCHVSIRFNIFILFDHAARSAMSDSFDEVGMGLGIGHGV